MMQLALLASTAQMADKIGEFWTQLDALRKACPLWTRCLHRIFGNAWSTKDPSEIIHRYPTAVFSP